MTHQTFNVNRAYLLKMTLSEQVTAESLSKPCKGTVCPVTITSSEIHNMIATAAPHDKQMLLHQIRHDGLMMPAAVYISH